tara:strand:- start:296960 stop:297754 length:795 start_codon:yes stop_codon:yes gene_type:complete
MPHNFKRGQRVRRIPVQKMNAAIDAANDRDQFGNRPLFSAAHGDQFPIFNNTGVTVEQFQAVGLDAVKNDPADFESSFRDGEIWNSIKPTHADHLDRFAVSLHAIPDGRVGLARLEGRLNCRVNVLNVEHQYVRPQHNTLGLLETCGAGGGLIRWPRPFTATGEQWATVDLTPFTAEAFCYLVTDLQPPTVSGSPPVLTPSTVNARIYDFDSSGVWSSTDDDIELNSMWENVSADESTLALARLQGSKWRLVALGCQSSELEFD